jgi:hypothetical protein
LTCLKEPWRQEEIRALKTAIAKQQANPIAKA